MLTPRGGGATPTPPPQGCPTEWSPPSPARPTRRASAPTAPTIGRFRELPGRSGSARTVSGSRCTGSTGRLRSTRRRSGRRRAGRVARDHRSGEQAASFAQHGRRLLSEGGPDDTGAPAPSGVESPRSHPRATAPRTSRRGSWGSPVVVTLPVAAADAPCRSSTTVVPKAPRRDHRDGSAGETA